jgi:hypothetical protein
VERLLSDRIRLVAVTLAFRPGARVAAISVNLFSYYSNLRDVGSGMSSTAGALSTRLRA